MNKEQIKSRLLEVKEELSTIKAQLAEDDRLPYAHPIPKEIIFRSKTIEKHYLSRGQIHKGSIRVVKPEPNILVYLSCKKEHKWDADKAICSPNPSVYMSIVPRIKKYIDEAEDWIRAYPEIKVRRVKEVGIEPRVSEEQKELEAVNKALDNAEVVE